MLEIIRKTVSNTFGEYYYRYIINNDMIFEKESETGHIEYKRNMLFTCDSKTKKYASQMDWRIRQNKGRKYAIYYIGVDDNGDIYGIPLDEIERNLFRLVNIVTYAELSIVYIHFILINDKIIIKTRIKRSRGGNNIKNSIGAFIF